MKDSRILRNIFYFLFFIAFGAYLGAIEIRSLVSISLFLVSVGALGGIYTGSAGRTPNPHFKVVYEFLVKCLWYAVAFFFAAIIGGILSKYDVFYLMATVGFGVVCVSVLISRYILTTTK